MLINKKDAVPSTEQAQKLLGIRSALERLSSQGRVDEPLRHLRYTPPEDCEALGIEYVGFGLRSAQHEIFFESALARDAYLEIMSSHSVEEATRTAMRLFALNLAQEE